MTVMYAVLPVASDRSTATAEIGNAPGFVVAVRSIQLPGPPLTLVATQMWPPVGINGPSPSVPAYTTLESPAVSLMPPAASARTRFTSLPVQLSFPPVSKLLVSAENPAPSVEPRHTRHVPSSIAPEFCGSSIKGVKNGPESPPTVAFETTKLLSKSCALQSTPKVQRWMLTSVLAVNHSVGLSGLISL